MEPADSDKLLVKMDLELLNASTRFLTAEIFTNVMSAQFRENGGVELLVVQYC